MLTAEDIVHHLGLEPLEQEGGFFRRTFSSPHRIENSQLGSPYPAHGRHRLGSVIYFLLTADVFSAMHRLPSSEIWFHHLGDPVEMLMLHPGGESETVILGPDILAGQQVQHTCPAHVWQGVVSLPQGTSGFTLFSAAVCPGFEWSDFELGDAADLIVQYPHRQHAIRQRTREAATE